MHIFVVFSMLILGVTAMLLDSNRKALPVAEPAYLDQLLKEERYEEFSYLMGIDNVELVKPGKERMEHPYFNEILGGDMLLGKDDVYEDEEQDRQGLNFRRYRRSKWPGGTVPYAISDDFDDDQKTTIQNGINRWNEQMTSCVRFVPRENQEDYVMFFSGNGCYARLGRSGGQQPLSLQKNGCLHQSVILHEMEHAIGIHHEHNRSDRDDFVKVLWENIPQRWRSQYQKTNTRDYVLLGGYEYYSIMHYGYYAPGTRDPAFEILKEGVDTRKIGRSRDLTDMDKQKICELYA